MIVLWNEDSPTKQARGDSGKEPKISIGSSLILFLQLLIGD